MGKRVTKLVQSKLKEKSWVSALDEFLFQKRAQGRSITTINDYERHVGYFFNRFPNSWQTELLRSSVMEYMSDDIKPATYNLRWVYLRAFFSWCVEEGYLIENPLEDLKKRKTQDRIVDIPEDTLSKLLKLPDCTTYTGLRDYSMITFTLDTGIRPKEALSLSINDFDLKRMLVTIPAEQAKTRIPRTLPLLYPTVNAIARLIQARHPSWNSDAPVFCSDEGTKMNTNSWGDRLEVYSKQLDVKVRPYDLRHSFALLYLRSGGNAFGLQKILGHSDMNMSKKYVNLSGRDLQEAHLVASPLNKLLKTKKRVRNLK